MLKALLLAQSPQTCLHAALLVDDALATALHALCPKFSTMLQATPGGLAFSSGIFLNILLLEDKCAILLCQEQLVNDLLLCINKKHVNFDKHIKYHKCKFKPKSTGPFEILPF